MGYQISYENGGVKTNFTGKKQFDKMKGIRVAILIVIGIFLVACISSEEFRHLLLPGNEEVTRAAVTDLVESIQSGEGMEEAITAFCRQIIENAQ